MSYPNTGFDPSNVKPRKKHTALKVIVTVLAAAFLLFIIIASVASCNPTTPTPGPGQLNAPVQPTTATTQAQSYHTPVAGDFTLQVVTLSQQCFGSAGCNVTYRVQPQCDICAADDPTKEYVITYTLAGASDGQQVGNFTLTGSTASNDSQDFTQTTSSKTQLTATVTAVLPG